MMILFVFLASYAVASEAILNQNLELSAKYIFVDLFRKAYFHIYGELFMDGDDYEASTVVGSYVVMYVLGFYMLICNVLLLNLLIAMFSTTYAKIQDQSADYWHFQRYSLIQEYSSRPFLPPPFIIFNHVYRLIMEKCLKENKNKDKGGLTAQRVEMSTEEKELLIWENTVVRQNFHQRRDKDKEQLSLDNQLQMTADRISHIVEKIDGLEIDKRLKAVEDQMTQSVQTLISLSRTGLNNSSSKSHEVEPLTSLQNRTPSVPEETQDEEKPNEKEENNEAEEQKPVHIASRSFYYDMTSVLRFPVPDDKVHWETSFPGYEPVIYTDFAVLSSENPEVDPVDLLTMDPSNRVAVLPFNNPDGAHKCDRRSHAGEYDVVDGLPQNPYGRTGIKGRGSLGRWGPNHVQHGILTRWKRNANRKKKIKDGKPILEFIALQRIDKKDGIYLLPVVKDLQYEFIDSVRSQASEQMKNQIENRLKAMQSEDEEIYHGYADDPRNTDNAWVETIALNYHDEEDLQSYYTVKTKQGTGVTSVSWQDVSSETSVWGFHSYLLGCTAELRGANF